MIRCFLLFGFVILLSFNISCKKNKEIPVSKDSITILYIGDERIFFQDYWGMGATYWMFLPLVSNVGDERREIRPVLAESWTHTDDYKTWTVFLRKDIYWHDGVQMTAEDIKFTIDLRKKVTGTEGNIECELIDDFTFIIKTEKPITSLPGWHVYYPKHLLEQLDPETFYNWEFWTRPIGNGPYKFVRNMPKTMVEVEANSNYFRGEPKIKKAILKFSQSPSLQELLSGNVDALTYVPRDFLLKIKGDDRFKSYFWGGDGGWIESLFWNHNNPLFSEATVRKALTMAIDRIELSKVLNNPDSIPVFDVMTTRAQRARADMPVPVPYDTNKAIALLNECGWSDTNADGILDKNGKDFRFTVIVGESNKIMATYIQDKFKQIGILMDIETLDFITVRERLKKSGFEALITRFPSHDLVRLRNYFGESNYINYKNKKIDELFNRIQNTGDPTKIDTLYKMLRPIFLNDVPITFLVPQVQTHIVSKKVKGLHNLYKPDPVWFLESLWIE